MKLKHVISQKRVQASLLAVLIAVAVVVAAPGRAISQTAMAAYENCMDEAAVEANNCYMSADGYFKVKACDWNWDINKLACVRALIKAVSF